MMPSIRNMRSVIVQFLTLSRNIFARIKIKYVYRCKLININNHKIPSLKQRLKSDLVVSLIPENCTLCKSRMAEQLSSLVS